MPEEEVIVGVGSYQDITVTANVTDTSIEVVSSIAGEVGPQGEVGPIGETGPPNTLAIGTVTSDVTADATITGTSPDQTLNLVLPQGEKGDVGSQGIPGPDGEVGPANSLAIGTVIEGTTAATITGAAPHQTLNLVLAKGNTGEKGTTGNTGAAGAKGDTGAKGNTGDKGDKGNTGTAGTNGTDGNDGYTPIKGVDYNDGAPGLPGSAGQDGYTPIKGVDYNDGAPGLPGANGADGTDGADGKGVASISLLSSEPPVDHYMITYTDASESYFDVTNGVDGAAGADGTNGTDGQNGADGYTPIKDIDYFDGAPGADGNDPYIEGGYWYINGASTGVLAEGTPGADGTLITVNTIAAVDGDITIPIPANTSDLTNDSGYIGASEAITLESKRILPRQWTAASAASVALAIDSYDHYELTAQAEALSIDNYGSVTPGAGEKILISILDDGTARAISYGTDYVARAGVALPTTTVASKLLTLGFMWNAGLAKYVLMAVGQEA